MDYPVECPFCGGLFEEDDYSEYMDMCYTCLDEQGGDPRDDHPDSHWDYFDPYDLEG